ncbi:hypothetical protein DPMN_078566 [Dreissena polymorpha]|uniref:Uncharacterized protein n=1 Tax=Dreissena polymorpha TaxID=45954 RepID=A0A9D3YMG4_DREPO|nr:hypothetical protein DPMN_078566 [Dreissena polymorpha]
MMDNSESIRDGVLLVESPGLVGCPTQSIEWARTKLPGVTHCRFEVQIWAEKTTIQEKLCRSREDLHSVATYAQGVGVSIRVIGKNNNNQTSESFSRKSREYSVPCCISSLFLRHMIYEIN